MPVADSSFGLKIGFEGVLKASLAAEAVVDGVKAIGHAISYIGRGMVGALKDGLDYNVRMEQYTTSFTTMLGDQAKAQKLVNNLKLEAARTPFGMEDLAKATQTLMGFGMSAEESLVSGLWQGIQSLAGWLWNRVSKVSSIWNGIFRFFGIHSPSKQMAWVARQCFYG